MPECSQSRLGNLCPAPPAFDACLFGFGLTRTTAATHKVHVGSSSVNTSLAFDARPARRDAIITAADASQKPEAPAETAIGPSAKVPLASNAAACAAWQR
jgi:hypothetical protein